MVTLRFLGCKGDRSLIKTRSFQADSTVIIEGDKKVMLNCGDDWTDKVELINPDIICLTSAEPEHAYGIMKYDKCKVLALGHTHEKLSGLYDYPTNAVCKNDDGIQFCGYNGTSVLLEIYGKKILYAPEFCPEDLDALKKADMLIGNGYSFKENVIKKGISSNHRYVSMLNQISLCKKYGISEIIFTAFGEECVKMGSTKLYKALASYADDIEVTIATHGMTYEIDEFDEIFKSVRQPFGSPGGKRFMLKHLLHYMPKHNTYVECFMGGGSLFFKKEPSQKEVVCDKDPEIYFLYKYIQTCTDEDLETLGRFNWRSSKQLFEQLKSEETKFMEKAEPAQDFFSQPEQPSEDDPNKLTPGQNENKNKRFYRLMYLKRFSDAGFMKSWNKLTEGKMHTICERIKPVRERLQNVIIMNDSYENAIRQYDAADTFHFIDPPYPNAQYPWKYQIDPHELNEVLKSIKGKFLLTYEKQGRNIFNGFYQRFIKLRSQANPWRGVINKTELLIANYPFDRKSKIKE